MVIKNQTLLKRKDICTDFEKQRNELLKKSEISLWLDSYDDIFSDFDLRPNSQRALSQDFLEESKRALRYSTSNDYHLNLLIEEKLRDDNEEETVKKRLHEHFTKHFHLQKKQREKILKKGIIFVIIGVCLLFLATFLLVNYGNESYFLAFLLIVMEPAGWFFAWEGLDLAIFTSKDETQDYDFYKKMQNCEIIFSSY